MLRATRSNRRCRRAASPMCGGAARILRRCLMTLGLMARRGTCGRVVSTTALSQAFLATDTPRTCLCSGSARVIVLIAYELNGEPLPPEHGFPARLLAPGYYGTNNVKWLSRLTLAKTRAAGPFLTRWYNDVVEHPAGQPRCNPVWAIAPDSVIVSPAPDQSYALGSVIEIWGWAWSDGAATALDVSFDAGVRWATARLDPPSGRSWQRFTTTWAPKAPGRYEIVACAQAAEGRKQPSVGARNAIHRVAVEVV
jgi:sulfane dehydrogenase subunit SoxC